MERKNRPPTSWVEQGSSPAQRPSIPRLVRCIPERSSQISLEAFTDSERREFYALIAKALELIWEKFEECVVECETEGVRYLEDDALQGFHLLSRSEFASRLQEATDLSDALRLVFSHYRGVFLVALEQEIQQDTQLFPAIRARMSELMRRRAHSLPTARDPEDEMVSGFMTARGVVLSLVSHLPTVVRRTTGVRPSWEGFLQVAAASESTLARLAGVSLVDFLSVHVGFRVAGSELWPQEIFSFNRKEERIVLSPLAEVFLDETRPGKSDSFEKIGCPALFTKRPGGNVIFDLYRRFLRDVQRLLVHEYERLTRSV